jgi:putative hemolysin
VLDNDLVIGILHTKEFAALMASGEKNWTAIIRPVLKVQSTDSAFGVLRLMQEKRTHMTIVYTSSGERLGVVTMEDIMEEIVGDIYDEDDDGKVRKVYATKARARFPRDPTNP